MSAKLKRYDWRRWRDTLPVSTERHMLLGVINDLYEKTLRVEGECREVVERLIAVNELLGVPRAETIAWLTSDATIIEGADTAPPGTDEEVTR